MPLAYELIGYLKKVGLFQGLHIHLVVQDVIPYQPGQDGRQGKDDKDNHQQYSQ